MRIDGLSGDRQAKTETSLAAVETHERGERFLVLAGRQTAAAVLNLDAHSNRGGGAADLD